MLVKVGNQIHDSSTEIITVVFTQEEKDYIKTMPNDDDIITVSNTKTSEADILKFNKVFHINQEERPSKGALTLLSQESEIQDAEIVTPGVKAKRAQRKK